MRTRSLLPVVMAAVLMAACGPTSPTGRPPDARSVAGAITEAGLRARLESLAAATGTSAPYRAVGSAGYDAAADLVVGELRAAGWAVTDDAVTDASFVDEGGSLLDVGGRSFGAADLLPLIFAPAGEVEGPVVSIVGDPAAADASAKGCAVTHYGRLPRRRSWWCRAGHACAGTRSSPPAGRRRRLHRGQPAPGPGVVYRPTLIEPRFLEIPAAAVSREAAAALQAAAAGGATARRVTHARTAPVRTRSILAELPGSEPGVVVMLGAHLDSVIDGPGMNDDGSGVAALLEIARALGGTRPRATIRLAFWSGEELGLHGSYGYATALSADARRAILVYLNADMIGSPNGFAGVYSLPGAPSGSGAVRDLLVAAVERAGGTAVGVDLGSGSDHAGFAAGNIAVGGVFSGANEPSPWTGRRHPGHRRTAGRPRYHRTCDDLANLDARLARVLTAALADVTVRLANNPELLRR